MGKSRTEVAVRLGIKVKTNSEAPGIYINNGNGIRKVEIEELFPEFKVLNHSSFPMERELLNNGAIIRKLEMEN
ncbi:hypothetical protein SAMN05880501_101164 [Ureibacillus xyleni]|uniref:Uncharacterized protein n=1 Tax=Ureibacillus xyleni TaxID=614648 RepID=A0A285R9T0_9BACL|nr:hypothetical protein [Ureibacillus xyleni]SOB90459.1 hypothetical protein SAMN05880501_101164 [Ureibacillus xyleni]